MDYRGEDLASVLYFLAETADPILDVVVAAITEVIDGFEGFEFNNVGTDRVGFSARFQDSRGIVQAANLSDGTLSLIGTLVLLMNTDRSSIPCLEEPENGLTPRATRAVYEAIGKGADPGHKFPASQILISSHSPFVICEAWNGEEREVIYQVKAEDGHSLIRDFASIIEEEGIQLGKEKGERSHLSLNTADQIMAGYWS